MSAGALGAAALRDRDFVASLHRGCNPRLRTVDSVLAVMGEPPAGPAFLEEVEAFLAVTGIKRSLLGRGATGNPSFVAQLRKGVSPTLATVKDMRLDGGSCERRRVAGKPGSRRRNAALPDRRPAAAAGVPCPLSVERRRVAAPA